MDASSFLAVGEHDLDVAKILSQENAGELTTVSDWLVTIHFYAVRMYLKALETVMGLSWQRHEEVHRWLNTTSDLLPIARSYRNLDRLSRSARYAGRTFGQNERTRLARDFTTARAEIFARLAKLGVEPPAPRGPYL